MPYSSKANLPKCKRSKPNDQTANNSDVLDLELKSIDEEANSSAAGGQRDQLNRQHVNRVGVASQIRIEPDMQIRHVVGASCGCQRQRTQLDKEKKSPSEGQVFRGTLHAFFFQLFHDKCLQCKTKTNENQQSY